MNPDLVLLGACLVVANIIIISIAVLVLCNKVARMLEDQEVTVRKAALEHRAIERDMATHRAEINAVLVEVRSIAKDFVLLSVS